MRRFKIVICRGPECGGHRGSAALFDMFRDALERNGAQEHTEVAWQSCFGRCTQGPNVLVREILTTQPMPTLGSGFATVPARAARPLCIITSTHSVLSASSPST